MNLKKIRKERGFSQRYMADQLKIGISTYNQYENSNRKIPLDKAKDIAKILNMKIEDIFFHLVHNTRTKIMFYCYSFI